MLVNDLLIVVAGGTFAIARNCRLPIIEYETVGTPKAWAARRIEAQEFVNTSIGRLAGAIELRCGYVSKSYQASSRGCARSPHVLYNAVNRPCRICRAAGFPAVLP